ncbi:MAG: amidase [Acidobacteria bacterium]|nr:amidase [Acidobacteriota bacterium]
MSEELATYSATRLARMMRERVVSPVEVVEAHLRRIERLNPALNAVVTLAPDVLDQARGAEAAIMRGARVDVLCGLPITVKDTIDVRGLRATAGTKVRKDFTPAADARAVASLREAGAIILGKTNCSEMALDYTTDNPVFGRTNNPFDLTRTPGGSSGGCAAAVSACLSTVSLGSDLVGSIRIPAHFCGVAGLKPTAGRVAGAGHFPPMNGPYQRGASLGPLARTIEDLDLFFHVLTGDSFEAEVESAEQPYERASAGLRGKHVAWYADDGTVPVSVETRRAVEKAAGSLRVAGLNVDEMRPPNVEHATELWLSLFSSATRELVSAAYAGRESDAGQAAQAILRHSADVPAQTLEAEQTAWTERGRLRAELLQWMETTPLIVSPVGAVPAFRHDAARKVYVGEQPIGIFRAFSYAQAYNVFDLPAVCVPAGRTPEGLPVGVQIAGRPDEERTILAAARIVEEALGGWQAPPENLSAHGRLPL